MHAICMSPTLWYHFSLSTQVRASPLIDSFGILEETNDQFIIKIFFVSALKMENVGIFTSLCLGAEIMTL